MLYVSLFMAALTFVSCRSTSPLSPVKDIGVFNTIDAKGQVIYSEGSVVFNKACDSSATLPYTRSCSSSQTPKQMDLAKYLGALPYDTGAFARDANGLSLISKAIADAQANNQESVVLRLTPIKSNIQKILKIKDNLTSNVVLTVYDYQDDFTKLLAPFGGSD